MAYYKISFIGSGNLAWHLAQAAENAGHSVVEVYSRNIRNAEKLCTKLYEAAPTENLYFANSPSEIFIIAVADRAISQVVRELVVPRSSIVVHVSGMESIEALCPLPNPFGVFYPIQTFSKSRALSFKEIPISLEASDKSTGLILKLFAETLSKNIAFHTTEERRIIHLSSVFAANFTNHMYTISKGLLESNDLKFDLVRPLIMEVVRKALEIDPENAQTGPAVRKDFKTIEKHLHFLTEEEGLTRIYQAVTDDIIKTYE